MTVIVFNPPGIIMAGAATGVAIGVGSLLGTDAEGPLTMMAGLLVLVFDLAYRGLRDREWFVAAKGGSLFWLPAWEVGVLWVILGIVYTASA